MAVSFVIYEKATGRVECLYSCPDGHVEASFAALLGEDASSYGYVTNRSIDPAREYIEVESVARENVPREPFDLTVAGNVVSGVPEGTEVLFLSGRNRVTMDASGLLEIEVDYPETISLKLVHPHHLTTDIDVECEP